MYKVILFDVDDTLFDFGICEKKAFKEAFLDAEEPNAIERFHTCYREISTTLWQELEEGKWSVGELGSERFRRLFRKHALELDAEIFNNTYLHYLGKEAHLIEGVESVFGHLKQHRLAVVTNGYQDVQQSRIDSSSLYNVFECVVTSEEAGTSKPDRRIFDYVFEKLKLTEEDKNNVLIVGDSLTSDIKGGHDYGIHTCWFNRFQKRNNTGILPTYEIGKLTDLLGVLSSGARVN